MIVDIPLLFELNFARKIFTYTIVCDCNSDKSNHTSNTENENSEQIKRLLQRDKTLTIEDAKARIKSQAHMISNMQTADFFIDNSGDIENTKRQVKELYNSFTKSKKYLRFRIGLFILSGFIIAKLFFICFK